MHTVRGFTRVLLLLAWAPLACSVLTPAVSTAPAEPSLPPPTDQSIATVPAEPSLPPPTDQGEPPPTTAPTARPTASPVPTAERLELEVVQSQVWTDNLGNARVNVLFHNPYDFPVSLGTGSRATLRNSAGEALRDGSLYFLDGISGGNGFLLAGETVAANACFTCEKALLTEEWASVDIVTSIEDATGQWDYFTEVEPSAVAVTFDGDSPLFDVAGSVTNNSGTDLQRISVRTNVFDQAGNLVGASEASAWDVPAGATVSFGSYGIGQAPAGPVTYEVNALGVNY